VTVIADSKATRQAVPQAGERPTDAFECYLHVRDCVRAMKQGGPSGDALTRREQQLVAAVEPLWDADADHLRNLRSYSKSITGVRRSHYKGPHAEGLQRRLERDLERLIEKGDPALLADEPRAFGGFGFRGFGKTYNDDTLRFFRVISLLQDAALIKDFRTAPPRPTVWEIGGGWGGLAYQFKTVCPDVTYLITGAPDLFLVSAVYLMTLFPGAVVRFFDPAQPDAFWRDWDRVDFAFAPEDAIFDRQPPRLDLTIDLAALDGMSVARVERHVQRAWELGCRYFFTVCPEGEVDPEIAIPVEPIVDRWYWAHPVSTAAGLTKRLALGAPKGRAIARTYRLGWRRLRR
jgi:hypothetical protein